MLNLAFNRILSGGGSDGHPFAVDNPQADGRVGMDLDKRFALLTAQTRDIAMLLVDKLTWPKRGEHKRIVALRLTLFRVSVIR